MFKSEIMYDSHNASRINWTNNFSKPISLAQNIVQIRKRHEKEQIIGFIGYESNRHERAHLVSDFCSLNNFVNKTCDQSIHVRTNETLKNYSSIALPFIFFTNSTKLHSFHHKTAAVVKRMSQNKQTNKKNAF